MSGLDGLRGRVRSRGIELEGECDRLHQDICACGTEGALLGDGVVGRALDTRRRWKRRKLHQVLRHSLALLSS